MKAMARSELHPFDWGALAPRLIHPMKVAIIEAIDCIGEPLSATDLRKVFDERFNLQAICYHLGKLAEAEVIEKVRQRQVRGALERFYSLS
jgi:DNA-binding transcriptional ArsR family regulator